MPDAKSRRIGTSDIERMFRYVPGGLPEGVRAALNRMNTTYRLPSLSEQSAYILDFLNLCEKKELLRNREENLAAFENGWTQNYESLLKSDGKNDFHCLTPGYFRGSPFFRYDNKLVVTDNLQLEFDLFTIARHCLFDSYLAGRSKIFELGCGSCQNLLMLSDLFPDKAVTGLDWTLATQTISRFLAEKRKRALKTLQYDMFSDKPLPGIGSDGALISIHAFEQLGKNFFGILGKIMAARPGIVVQLEPVTEFYDADNLLDFLALKYIRKRNYLDGYYTALSRMAQKGDIEILAAWRPYLGGVLHESSILVWRPV
jgi:hypothetical protein